MMRTCPLAAIALGALIVGCGADARGPNNERERVMSKPIEVTFTVDSWEETAYDEFGAQSRLTRAHVAQSYQGDIEGASKLEYLMAHRSDGTASYTGLERVTGSLLGRRGSFVLRHDGTFEGGVARSECQIIAGLGTDGLSDLRGNGEVVAEHGGAYRMKLEVTFESP